MFFTSVDSFLTVLVSNCPGDGCGGPLGSFGDPGSGLRTNRNND